MKALIFIIGITFLMSCKTTEEVTEIVEETEVTTPSKPQRPYQVEARIGKFSESDDLKIIRASITGNTLTLEVTYAGGCGMHEFDFVGDPAIMKSMPPQRNVKLIHKANNDSCESIVNQTIEVDITELAVTETKGSEIVLRLDGFKSTLKYTYE